MLKNDQEVVLRELCSGNATINTVQVEIISGPLSVSEVEAKGALQMTVNFEDQGEVLYSVVFEVQLTSSLDGGIAGRQEYLSWRELSTSYEDSSGSWLQIIRICEEEVSISVRRDFPDLYSKVRKFFGTLVRKHYRAGLNKYLYVDKKAGSNVRKYVHGGRTLKL